MEFKVFVPPKIRHAGNDDNFLKSIVTVYRKCCASLCWINDSYPIKKIQKIKIIKISFICIYVCKSILYKKNVFQMLHKNLYYLGEDAFISRICYIWLVFVLKISRVSWLLNDNHSFKKKVNLFQHLLYAFLMIIFYFINFKLITKTILIE